MAATPETTTPTAVERDRLYIGGEWVDPLGDGRIEVIDPAREEVIGHVPEGTPADVDRAVSAARGALPEWSALPVQERAQLASAVSVALQQRQAEIAALITREVGSPIRFSTMVQAGLAIMDFGSIAHLVEEIPWEQRIGNSVVVRDP